MLVDATPPEGGGHLFLTKSQINNWELVCAIKSTYRQTKILLQQELPVSRQSGYAK